MSVAASVSARKMLSTPFRPVSALLVRGNGELTFFCSLITLVHFFSSRPAHFAFESGAKSVWME